MEEPFLLLFCYPYDIIEMMEETAKKKLIFSQFLIWYFLEQPRAILGGWRNLLKFNLNYFSVPLLLRTLFSPWRRYRWSYGRGFDFKIYLEASFSNAISRGLGAIMRLILILVGIFTEILLILLGVAFLLLWYFLPIILISVFIYGLNTML